MRIGIDVGGTNTDAVLMSGPDIRATAKTATTGDVTSGILAALDQLQHARRFAPDAIDAVVVGTTHFTSALLEAKGLAGTAVVRLGLPATAALPPLSRWPDRLVRAISARRFLCCGGHEFDGRPLARVDEEELRGVATDIRAAGIRSVAISAVFSTPYADCERRAAEILTREVPSLRVTLSHEVGRHGLLGRENAAVINACLRDLVDRVADALVAAMRRAGLAVPLYLTQNDGTAMDLEFARRFPVAAFASGPANSLRGAAFLSGFTDCLVVDVGGATTDVGVLAHGSPRLASGEVSVAGVRTNLRMPQLSSAPVGGGSVVGPPGGDASGLARRHDATPLRPHDGPLRPHDAGVPVDGPVDGSLDGDGWPVVGPHSVGNEIIERALVFGGDTLTASDLAVAAGGADIGARRYVAHLDPRLVRRGLEVFRLRVLEAARRLRASPERVPVVLVGGGSPLLTDGISEIGPVHRPEHYEMANAVGAATASVGGETDRIFPVGPGRRQEILQLARVDARSRAVEAGAAPQTVEIVDVHESPLTYLPGATRVRARAVGDLSPAEPPLEPPAELRRRVGGAQ